jgi:hypothetical protein
VEGTQIGGKMSQKITLPSGATVTLKDPALLRVKDRKRVLKTADVEGGDLTRALALGDALIAMLIEDWSLDLLIPSLKIDNLDELEMKDYDALVEATKDAQKFLFPSLGETVENEQDPKAPTDNSNA